MNQATNDAIIKELTRAYWLELEATINYLAHFRRFWTASVLKRLRSHWQRISKRKLHMPRNLPPVSKRSTGASPVRSPLNRNKPRFNPQKIPQILFQRSMGLSKRKIWRLSNTIRLFACAMG